MKYFLAVIMFSSVGLSQVDHQDPFSLGRAAEAIYRCKEAKIPKPISLKSDDGTKSLLYCKYEDINCYDPHPSRDQAIEAAEIAKATGIQPGVPPASRYDLYCLPTGNSCLGSTDCLHGKIDDKSLSILEAIQNQSTYQATQGPAHYLLEKEVSK